MTIVTLIQFRDKVDDEGTLRARGATDGALLNFCVRHTLNFDRRYCNRMN